MTKTFTGHIHNAKRCTFDGRDCFIAAIHVNGRFKADEPGDIVSEHKTVADAEAWLVKALAGRGEAAPQVTLDRRTILEAK